MAKTGTKTNITESLKELSEIVAWFEQQNEVDVEEGIEKVKEAARLIKESKARLADIENEFKEIEKEVRSEISTPAAVAAPAAVSTGDEIDPEEIPF